MRANCILAALLLTASAASAGGVKFSTKPTAAKAGGKVKTAFAVSGKTDVEVSVLDAKGKVVRHLAAGLLGGEKPPPRPLKAGLSQALEWDGKDDLGKKAAGGPFKVRVRAGAEPTLGAALGEPGAIGSAIHGLATDEKGRLYVASAGGYKRGRAGGVWSVKVFDRKGKYLKTIMPYAADLKLGEVTGFGKQELRDGKLNPPSCDQLLPWIYPGGLGGIMGNRVQGGVLWLTNGRGQVCRVKAENGACISWGQWGRKMKPPAPPSRGPICWGPSPDEKMLYLAGWYYKRGKRPATTPDGQVFKVDPATGTRSPFIKIDVPAGSYWHKDSNGWYAFTNWGRKNGCAALHGLAVDKEGRVYVCDRVNQRIGVYDKSGKYLGGTKVEWPDLVALSPKGKEIYVTTRKVVNGYKTINEVKVLKLSGWKDGEVLAELTLPGSNAPSMAVDATEDPAVIWLSNVGEGKVGKGKAPAVSGVTRIEDRGTSFVVAGKLGGKSYLLPEAVVKVWADPMSDDFVVSDGGSGLYRCDGLKGTKKPFSVRGMDLCFARDGYIYVYGQKGWHEMVAKFDRSGKPAAYKATGKNITTKTTTGKDIYGRMGHGLCNKGIWVSPRGRIFAYNMYDWAKYFINVWDADGKAEKHPRIGDGLLGPLDPQSGGLRVDWAGNIYVGMHGGPKGAHHGRRDKFGAVVKFPPTGGGYVAKGGSKPGMAWSGSTIGKFLEGAGTTYPGLSPQVSIGCVCKEARFDLDGWGRLYVPDGVNHSFWIYDNAGNPIRRIGHYGNPESAGAESPVPDPAIAFGWNLSVSAGQVNKGRLYVADTLNRRVILIDLKYAAEETYAVK